MHEIACIHTLVSRLAVPIEDELIIWLQWLCTMQPISWKNSTVMWLVEQCSAVVYVFHSNRSQYDNLNTNRLQCSSVGTRIVRFHAIVDRAKPVAKFRKLLHFPFFSSRPDLQLEQLWSSRVGEMDSSQPMYGWASRKTFEQRNDSWESPSNVYLSWLDVPSQFTVSFRAIASQSG